MTAIPNSMFDLCANLTSVVIPETITSIGTYAFYSCSSLASIEIPASVTSIGNYAFFLCSGLNTLTSRVENPSQITLGSGAFQDVPKSTCTLYVSKGGKALYAAADQWKDFENIVEFIYSAELIDGETYTANEDRKNANITYTRTFENACWQALYLPFDINYDEWEALGDIACFNGVHQYDTNGDHRNPKLLIG